MLVSLSSVLAVLIHLDEIQAISGSSLEQRMPFMKFEIEVVSLVGVFEEMKLEPFHYY